MPLFMDNMRGSTGERDSDGAVPQVAGIPPIFLMFGFLLLGWWLFRISTKR